MGSTTTAASTSASSSSVVAGPSRSNASTTNQTATTHKKPTPTPFLGFSRTTILEAKKLGKRPSADHHRDFFKKNCRIREYNAHSAKVHTVDWNVDGRRLATGSFDKTVCIFSLDKDKLRKEHELRSHSDSVDQLRWHYTHQDILASASGDKTVRLWDARSVKCSEVIECKGENINIAWSNDGNDIAVGNKDDLISFIDVRTCKIRHEQNFSYEVNEICFSPRGDKFLLTNGLGQICIFDYPSMTLDSTVNAHPSNCISIVFHPDGHEFAVGSADALVSLWNWKELCCVRMFDRLDWPVRSLSFNHDGTLLASASEDLNIDVAFVDSGEKVTDIPVDTPTFTVAFHPTRNLVAYACDDRDKYDRNRDSGTIKLFGLPND